MELRTNTFDIPGADKFSAEVMFVPIFSIRIRRAADPTYTDLVRIDSEGRLSWSAPAAVDPATARIYSDAIALAAEMAEHLSTWRRHFETLEMFSDRPESTQ